MDIQPDENSTLKSVVDTLEQKAITFDIDVAGKGWMGKITRKKKSFTIRPLTLSQVHRISAILLDIDITDLTANGIFKILKSQVKQAAEIIAIAVTESISTPSKKLIDTLYHNLDHKDLDTALTIVFQQMEVLNFINTMVSIRTLNVLEKKNAGVKSAEKKEASPQVPGNLPAA